MAIRQSTSTSASPSPFQSSHQHEGTPGEVDDSNYIEKSALLDIAFLHSIASHRPIGPHKHFNVIPILLNLDRTARQVGARIRDDGYIRGASGEDTEGENSTTIKKEDMAEGEEGTPIPFTSLPINSQMIWLRLDQLYDVGGLEELEILAIENDVASPFRNGHALHHRRSSIQTAPLASTSTRFGFGSGLQKQKKAAATPKSSRKKAAATPVEEEDDFGDGPTASEEQTEFELGPWDEFESLIAPRRLKSYAPQEDEESEEELSEPSEVEGNDGVDEEGQQDDDALSEEDEEAEEEAEDDGEEDGEEEEAEDEGDTTASKRKASSKKQSAASKKAKKASSPSVKSKSTRQSAKPRRSARR